MCGDVRGRAGVCQREAAGSVDGWLFFEQPDGGRRMHPRWARRAAFAPLAGIGNPSRRMISLTRGGRVKYGCGPRFDDSEGQYEE